jgi:5-methyltetrahydropteroyltriglutamate--homocysteine methyltransferase
MPKWWSNDGSGRRFRFIELDALLWGDWYDTQGVHRKPGPERLGVVEKLNRRRYLSADEFSYLKKKTSRIPKVTIPSPTL